MKYTKHNKMGLVLIAFSLAFVGGLNAQTIIHTNDRQPGLCMKVDSLGRPYKVIYLPIQTESSAETENITSNRPMERVDTFWVNPTGPLADSLRRGHLPIGTKPKELNQPK
jgi:hypothetical protein